MSYDKVNHRSVGRGADDYGAEDQVTSAEPTDQPTDSLRKGKWRKMKGIATIVLHILDEDASEPDGYLYPASMFAPVELPEAAERVRMAAADD